MATQTVGNTRNGQTTTAGARFAVGVNWPTERWVGLIVLIALGLLIVIRLGFRGVGFQGNVGGRIAT
jgi:hypothetical protein